MAKVEWDEAREERITMKIVVDAYTAEEQVLGWYYYLEQTLQFPFSATCMVSAKKSKQVTVVGMVDEEECEREMFVEVEWDGDILPVRLEELTFKDPKKIAAQTQEAIEDWQYWVSRGYTFED